MIYLKNSYIKCIVHSSKILHITKIMRDKNNKLYTGVVTYVESLDDQERLLNEILILKGGI